MYSLNVNAVSIKRKFYASLITLLVRCSSVVEPVKVRRIKSYCLPLIKYCNWMIVWMNCANYLVASNIKLFVRKHLFCQFISFIL